MLTTQLWMRSKENSLQKPAKTYLFASFFFSEAATARIELTLSAYPIPRNIGSAIAPATTKVRSEVSAFGAPELRRLSNWLQINRPGANAKNEINRIESSSFLILTSPIRLLSRNRAKSELDKYPIPNDTAIPTVIKRIGRTK